MPPSRCIARPPITFFDSSLTATRWRSPSLPARAAAFSTTSPQCMPPPAKKKVVGFSGPPKRGVKALQIKKNVRVKTGRPPAPGERKALRKRIVLSNTNALEVPGLRDLDEGSIGDAGLQGKVLGLPGPIVDSLRAVEAFKTTQGWSLFRRPAALIRKETVEMGKLLEEVEAGDRAKTIRRVIVGERGSGKSILLLQAMAMAFLRGWVVINFPEAKDLTIAHTEHAPLAGTTPLQYIQKSYTATLLSQISKANAAVLSTLQLSRKHDLPIPLQSNISLDRLADLGARDPDIAWPVFRALWTELTQPTNPDSPGLARPPVLLALDGLAHVMRDSAYLAADARPVHAHDLALVRHFVDHLSGARALPNGGAVLAATSESNRPAAPALDLAVRASEARAAGAEAPRWDPYRAVDGRALRAVRDVEVLRLRGLSREEARGVMEYYAASGMLRQTVSEGLVSEKWTLAGGGIVGELEKGAVRLRI